MIFHVSNIFHQISVACIKVYKLSTGAWFHSPSRNNSCLNQQIIFILKYLLDLRILLNISRLLMAALNGRLPSFVHLFIQCSGVFVFENGQPNQHLIPRCIIDGHQSSLYQWLIIRYIKKLYVIVSAALINVIYIFVLCSCSR